MIEKFFDAFKEIEKIEDVKIMNHNPLNDETDSYTVMTLNVSTQGVNIKHLVSKDILVELPWLASQMDVKLCYAYLNAVKKVYRGARILDEEEKGVKLTETEAKEQWHLRCKNMDDIINRGETTVIAGAIRDFHLNPAKFIGRDEATNRIEDAFADFLHVQWTNLEAINIREEKRHITEDEELSTIRVVDNTEDVFIGACQYVGMMKGKAAIKRGQNDACISSAEREQARRDVNTCKMVKFEDFCKLMEEQEEFQLLDAAQALLNRMDDEQWNKLYDKAEGIVNFCGCKVGIVLIQESSDISVC